MARKFAPIFAAAVLAALSLAASAGAAKSMKVTIKHDAADYCRPAPDLVRYKLLLTAKIASKGLPKPSSVRVTYKILDATHSLILRTGVLKLKKKGRYQAKTRFISAQAESDLAYRLGISYTVRGRKIKAKQTIVDHVPSVATMDSYGVPTCGT